MNKDKLKVIQGGLTEKKGNISEHFISAHITDTRLMGVTGLYTHFRIWEDDDIKNIHQFIYFDAEEFGFENYSVLLNPSDDQISYLENRMFGGLGGRNIELKYEEAVYLIHKYLEFNEKRNIPLPDGFNKYSYLFDDYTELTENELYTLMEKQCVKITSDYELINYYLMRTVGCDFPAATYLSTQDFDINVFPEITLGTFLKNTIDETDVPATYINESLIETGNTYYLLTTEITIKNNLVHKVTRHSFSKITPYEAAIMMARPEIVSVYDFKGSTSCFHRDATFLTRKAMVNNHDTGDLYMMFHNNNDHVKHKVYRLNEDVLGIYYVTYSGQLISVAYSQEEIDILEQNLMDSPLCKELIPGSKYEFPDTLLYEFIESNLTDFDQFVEYITNGEE